jgi:hypothetical protein
VIEWLGCRPNWDPTGGLWFGGSYKSAGGLNPSQRVSGKIPEDRPTVYTSRNYHKCPSVNGFLSVNLLLAQSWLIDIANNIFTPFSRRLWWKCCAKNSYDQVWNSLFIQKQINSEWKENKSDAVCKNFIPITRPAAFWRRRVYSIDPIITSLLLLIQTLISLHCPKGAALHKSAPTAKAIALWTFLKQSFFYEIDYRYLSSIAYCAFFDVHRQLWQEISTKSKQFSNSFN